MDFHAIMDRHFQLLFSKTGVVIWRRKQYYRQQKEDSNNIATGKHTTLRRRSLRLKTTNRSGRLIAAFEEIDPEAAYHTAIALAHDENVSEWGAMISARLGELERESSDEVQVSISLLELQRAIDLPLIQVWLGLLLNEFAIEQRGEFYDTENIWIRAIISSRPDTCS